MSDHFTPPNLSILLDWILRDLPTNTLFHIPRELWFDPTEHRRLATTRFGQHLEAPLGVAAGPQTQLALNLVAAWLCGARYMELKTVQTLDELEISKPCIDMPDEGYNCEWSQELKVRDSYREYLKAWVLIHILRRELGWETGPGPGLIFNMSVGYDLAGIQQENVQEFFRLMADGSTELECLRKEIAPAYPAIYDLPIPTTLSDNITLSTMHGCPPDEIERIALYLMEEKGLHTAVKLNPTLLGPERLRQLLHDELGHHQVDVPDEAFAHDLKLEDARSMIRRLQASAQNMGVTCSLKLTNTLEVKNQRGVFPEKENMAYLSGRALHPLSVQLAALLQKEFEGALDISFCAGADAFNFTDLLACGLGPVTTCTDLLKPGGYTRLTQYHQELERRMTLLGADDLDDLIRRHSGKTGDLQAAALSNLERYAETVLAEDRYHQLELPFESIKTNRSLGEFDCIHAPCIADCAAGQDIPGYLYHSAQGDFQQAWQTIVDTNPLPGITGTVCDHLCQLKCTRNNYDQAVRIREIKRYASEFSNRPVPAVDQSSVTGGKRVAVIGAGPSGLSAAYFLARAGWDVDVFESRPAAGGMTQLALPSFRLPDETILQDTDLVRDLGVNFHFAHPVDVAEFHRLRNTYDCIYIGAGAQGSRKMGIPGEELSSVFDPLEFLAGVKSGNIPALGTQVLVIGGGNTAMDAARTARRLVGEAGEVTLVYRRGRRQMPADQDEIREALAEGIALLELVIPLSIAAGPGGKLRMRCQRAELGTAGADGRRRPVALKGSEFDLEASTIIPAVGQVLQLDFLPENGLQVDGETGATDIPGVYAGGDAVRGAASIVQAIGDGHRAARAILNTRTPATGHTQKSLELRDYRIRASKRVELPLIVEAQDRLQTPEEAMTEADRCLYCDDFCSVCVGVCPNLANLTYETPARTLHVFRTDAATGELVEGEKMEVQQATQVLNIPDLCNECGNCTTFCPTSGAPYRDKPRVHLDANAFRQDHGYHFHGEVLMLREQGREFSLQPGERGFLFRHGDVELLLDRKDLQPLEIPSGLPPEFDTEPAARMAVLYDVLHAHPLFGGRKGLPNPVQPV